jgi:YidC/Oxa1 family membrane protein insertase
MDLCLDEILSQILDKGYVVTVRPHPEYVKRFPQKMKRILERYEDRLGKDFVIQTDFSDGDTVYTSDIVITDWSSIAQEFSFTTKKPSLFINTPMKIMNHAYEKLSCVPQEISIRDKLGVSVDTDKLGTLPDVIAELLMNSRGYKKKITTLLNENVFDVGHGSESGGEYLIARVMEIEYLERNAAEDCG